MYTRNPLDDTIDTVSNVLRKLAEVEEYPPHKHKMEEAAEYIDYLESIVLMFSQEGHLG